jgi:alanine dehydrogenase
MVSTMKPGSVIVDVSIDQGGCAETTRPTTHTDPVVVVDGVLHYGVPNIPGIVPHTSTFALTNATLPFIVQLVEGGLEEAISINPGLRKGVNLLKGQLTCQAVGDAHGLVVKPLDL